MENIIYNTSAKDNWELPKFLNCENVRINKHREFLSNSYITPNWPNEVFKIRLVNYTSTLTCLSQDQSGKDIQGAFYTKELQKTLHPNIYLIQKFYKDKMISCLKYICYNLQKNILFNK